MSDEDLLALLLQATREGVLAWTAPGRDQYEAIVGQSRYAITFEWPVLNDGRQAKTSLCYVSVGEVVLTFSDGTPQAQLVESILAEAFQEWREGVGLWAECRQMEGERLRAMVAKQ